MKPFCHRLHGVAICRCDGGAVPLDRGGRPRPLAQFDGLRSTGDGSVLYFSTRVRQKGAAQPLHGKIFRIGPSGAWNLETGQRCFYGGCFGCYQTLALSRVVANDGTAVFIRA